MVIALIQAALGTLLIYCGMNMVFYLSLLREAVRHPQKYVYGDGRLVEQIDLLPGLLFILALIAARWTDTLIEKASVRARRHGRVEVLHRVPRGE